MWGGEGPQNSKTNQALANNFCRIVVQHKIFQKYQKSNLGQVTFLMKLSYFETDVEIVYFYE